MDSPPLGPPKSPYTMKELSNMQMWQNVQYKSIFCDLYNYFEIWHFYQIIHICWSSRHMWTISTAVQAPKMHHYAIKSILIRKIGRYGQSLLFQCNFFYVHISMKHIIVAYLNDETSLQKNSWLFMNNTLKDMTQFRSEIRKSLAIRQIRSVVKK